MTAPDYPVYHHCAYHDRDEPSRHGDYRACGECCHVWRTEQEFVDDVLRARADHAQAHLRYEGTPLPPNTTDPRRELFCPLCVHDF